MQNEIRNYNYPVEIRNPATITGVLLQYDKEYENDFYYEVIKTGAIDAEQLKDIPFYISCNNKDLSAKQLTLVGSADLNPENNIVYVSKALNASSVPDREIYTAISNGNVFGFWISFDVDEGGEQWIFTRTGKAIRQIERIEAINCIAIIETAARDQNLKAYDAANASITTVFRNRTEGEKRLKG